MPTRRQFLTAAGALLMADTTAPASALEAISPSDAGFQPDLARRFEAVQASGGLPNLHGIVALRGGRVFFERYFAGPDAAWGRPLGAVVAILCWPSETCGGLPSSGSTNTTVLRNTLALHWSRQRSLTRSAGSSKKPSLSFQSSCHWCSKLG